MNRLEVGNNRPKITVEEASRMVMSEIHKPTHVITGNPQRNLNKFETNSFDARQAYLLNGIRKEKIQLIPGDSWLKQSINKEAANPENGSIQKYLNSISDVEQKKTVQECSRRIRNAPLCVSGLAQIELKQIAKSIERANDRLMCSKQAQVNYRFEQDHKSVCWLLWVVF